MVAPSSVAFYTTVNCLLILLTLDELVGVSFLPAFDNLLSTFRRLKSKITCMAPDRASEVERQFCLARKRELTGPVLRIVHAGLARDENDHELSCGHRGLLPKSRIV